MKAVSSITEKHAGTRIVTPAVLAAVLLGSLTALCVASQDIMPVPRFIVLGDSTNKPFRNSLGLFYDRPRRLRIAATPPGYSSGFVSIFCEPHFEQRMCLPTLGTAVDGGNGTVAGLTSRS